MEVQIAGRELPPPECLSPPSLVAALRALPVSLWSKILRASFACCTRSTEPRHNSPAQRRTGQSQAGSSGTTLDFPSCLGREWQLDSERRTPADLRSKVYRTIMKLDNSE